MRASNSAIALIGALSSASASSRSDFASTYVRHLGMKAVHRARSNIINDRKLQLDNNDMGPMICALLESDIAQEGLAQAQEDEALGMVCSEFGCDDPNSATPNLIMDCKIDANICEDDLQRRLQTDEQFCVQDTEVQMSMGLNFADKSRIISTQCSNYTSPQYMADMGRVCWTVDVMMDFGTIMEDVMSGEMNEDMTQEEAAKAAAKYVEITECSSTSTSGVECDCGTCNEGIGFMLSCTNGLISEECTNLDTNSATGVTEGEAGGPSISVLKLVSTTNEGIVIEEPDAADVDANGGSETADVDANGGSETAGVAKASPAASRPNAAITTGFILTFASFLLRSNF